MASSYHFLNLPLIPSQKRQCSALPVLRYEYVSERERKTAAAGDRYTDTEVI